MSEQIGWFEKRKVPTYDYVNEVRPGVVEINDKCTGCGTCVKICPCNSLETVDGRARMTELSTCMFCGDCAAICPKGAVMMIKSYEIKCFYKTIDRGTPSPPRLNF
ncbi:MAG: 4Fe-4S binding protein [Bacillota bacterium]